MNCSDCGQKLQAFNDELIRKECATDNIALYRSLLEVAQSKATGRMMWCPGCQIIKLATVPRRTLSGQGEEGGIERRHPQKKAVG